MQVSQYSAANQASYVQPREVQGLLQQSTSVGNGFHNAAACACPGENSSPGMRILERVIDLVAGLLERALGGAEQPKAESKSSSPSFLDKIIDKGSNLISGFFGGGSGGGVLSGIGKIFGF